MSIKNILVPLDGTDKSKPVMTLGLSFGRELGVHVEVLHVRNDPKETIPLLGEGMSVSMIEDMIEIAEKWYLPCQTRNKPRPGPANRPTILPWRCNRPDPGAPSSAGR